MNLTQSALLPSPARSLTTGGARLLRSVLPWLLAVLLACSTLTARAAEITVSQASIEASDQGYRLSVSYDFELNRGLEDALSRGVPLYFTTEVQLTRRRWYWFDETSVSATRTVRVSYNVLTRQYHTAISGQLQQSFSNLEDAMTLIRRPPRWIIADSNTLKAGDAYQVGLRMRLDVAQLPKPFQVNALNNSDWRLSSDWIEFTYKPE
ncbi:hypothetical protein HBH1_03915 [Herbaspirillum sp. BH-1]|uniref:DUF4390 domain-containing protein n=1 Tax=Herbaspirillum frisingense TaxID=92645 RepID=A0ABU1PKC3_9BURK|nr:MULTISPECIES: DUF4390 domain-containing protein [Herbaspirillum]MDR6586373.1 hypothetical protein [Herbaspirillum frisingense]PLY57696.1 hypothetical protein HBH1_03915 [Herbaspirillum sp. BH-1]